MASGRFAIAMASSINASGVTQTGQPGPCTSSTCGGSSWSIPWRISVWVWPPHTSIRVQCRVTVRGDVVEQGSSDPRRRGTRRGTS